MHLVLRTILLYLFLTLPVLAKNKELTYEHFGHLPMFQHATVSPDGKMIAAVYNGKDGPSVVVSPFASRKVAVVARLSKSKDRIDGLTWVNSERIVISASYPKLSYGGYTRVNRMYAVNKDGTDVVLLQDKKAKNRPDWMDVLSTTRIVSLLEKDKKHILIQAYDEKDEGWSVFKVNVYDSDYEKLFVNKYKVSSWYANGDGQVVLGVQYDGNNNKKDTINIWHRTNNNDEWKLLHSRKLYDSTTFTPIKVDGNKAIVLTDHELYRQALWSYDIPSGKFEKVLFSHDKYDVDSALLSPDQSKVIGAVYYDHFRRNHFFDPNENNIHNKVAKIFSQYETSIVDFSLDRSKVLVLAVKDNSPPKYFWLDQQANKAGVWFSKYPHLENKPLANVEAFEFETQDKMLLNGYLTMPNNSDGKPPLIVYPHGGPNARDYQYFDPYVQYFANKGYAVLQVNFRGSTGFGNSYETAGYREWGAKMQSDVYEAVDWLATQNKVDMSKVCFVGASYGGYVALTAAAEKPNDYKCIVSVAGVSDVKALADTAYLMPTLRSFVENTIGHPKVDDDVNNMREISPINYVKNIKAPILLIHGAKDTRVSIKQSRKFFDEAKDADLDIQHIEYEFGTHFLDENDNRLSAFKEIGEFLEKHLN
ncbi:alpha/beta hydrolase family protein [Thalassotalea marina]|nr:alpha/beta fold hydrolase [Thalassotalea marina]